MKLLFAFGIVSCIIMQQAAHAQIKTSGIKTHYPTGSLVLDYANNNTNEQNYYYNRHTYNGSYVPAETYPSGGDNSYNDRNSYRPSYVPAETYAGGDRSNYYNREQGGSYSGGSSNYDSAPTRRPMVWDATAEFINKTRSTMDSGVCYREVPTTSLVHDRGMTPIGNGTTPNMSKIQVCCDGYERNPHVYTRCDPICKDDCPNGICTAPNTCVCIPGHVRNYDEKCISTCPLGCGNGECDAYGECRCKPGYKLEPLNKKYCEPHCEHGCQFGVCVGPNRCNCHEGYYLSASGVCEAKCDNCEYGKCTAPGFCSCNTGYLKVAGICEPLCALGCNNGRCVAPDTCQCSSGYALDRSGSNCVEHCDQPCLNGVCDGANTCKCNSGYIPDDYQRNVCNPHCPQGCPNGYCTSPNFCVCKPGYIKSGIKGRKTCIPV